MQPDIRSSIDHWTECSYEIHVRKSVDAKTIKLMKTTGQIVEASVIKVPNGRLRVTDRFIEGKDSAGIPFGWSKTLVTKVVTHTGQVLWWADGGPA